MRKPFKRDTGEKADPQTVEATLLYRLPGRLVAACRDGNLYHWETQRAQDDWEEGELVFVNFDRVTGTVFSMTRTGKSTASEE